MSTTDAPHLAGVPDTDMLRRYVYFVTERERIRTLKESGAPAPWTEDKILQEYKFCNMRRCDDRVSRWLINHMYTPHSAHPLLWYMAVVARWINWPPTLGKILAAGLWQRTELDDVWFTQLEACIADIVANGDKAWTAAYNITSSGSPKGMPKSKWIVNSTLRPIWQARAKFEEFFNRAPEHKTMQQATELFAKHNNFGTFMAGQIVCDWTYTPLLNRAPDRRRYAPIGPGSTRGLNRLYGRALEQRIPQAQFNAELKFAANALSEELDTSTFILHDIQNTFCEFDKYCRLLNGGQVRAKYQPETRF